MQIRTPAALVLALAVAGASSGAEALDPKVAKMEAESTALFATARLWDDGLIDPRDSRKVLAMCLSICREATVRPLKANTFGVARM